MTDGRRPALAPPVAVPDLSLDLPSAEADRRFYAFVIDRVLAWSALAAAGLVAVRFLDAADRPWTAVVLVGAAAVGGWGLFGLSLGIWSATPGLALLGLRVVDVDTGRPVGILRALGRGLVLGIAALPTLGLGLAMLAWTALTDPERRRRGWHDQLTGALVVDARSRPTPAPHEDAVPRHVVNLTALRLAPDPPESPGPGVAPAPRYVATAPPSALWVLTFDSGQRVVVDRVLTVGRPPDAELRVAADGALVVTDRGSARGSTLTRQGFSRPLPPGRAVTLLAGDVLRLGDRDAEVSGLPPRRGSGAFRVATGRA